MTEKAKLLKLAEQFPEQSPLFAVGGYVRNNLMNIACSDIDICSSLLPEKVKELLDGTEFSVCKKALRLGTLVIKAEDLYAEYTTFRTDNYPKDGSHSPNSVNFGVSMMEDAKRRDFTINAIYQNIKSGEIVDFTNGVKDIASKIIVTTDSPAKVFGEDGLRILRMVRFACQLGFSVEATTFNQAKLNAWRVADLAKERIADELKKIFVADTAYPELELKDAHYRGIKMLDELGLIKMLLPELDKLKGLEQPKKYHNFDAYNHSLEAFRMSKPNVRWSALLHDVGKILSTEQYGNMHHHADLGVVAVKQICKRYSFSTEEKNRIAFLVGFHMTDLNGNMSKAKLRWFIAQNQKYAKDLADLRDADSLASKGVLPSPNTIRLTYEEMLSDGTPMSLKELKVDGADLVYLQVPPEIRSQILKELWMDTVENPLLNNREKALNYIKKKLGRNDL